MKGHICVLVFHYYSAYNYYSKKDIILAVLSLNKKVLVQDSFVYLILL